MKKLIILLSIAFLIAVCPSKVSAQETDAELITVLIVNMTDGSVNEYSLPEKPVVTFSGDNMDITSTTLQDSYLKADVSHFTFEQKSKSGVDTPTQEELFSIRYIDNANVEVYSPKLNGVEIYSISGQKMASAAAANGRATVSVADLVPGVYLVTTNCHAAVKIIKK